MHGYKSDLRGHLCLLPQSLLMCGAITKPTINFAEYEFKDSTEDALNLQFQAAQI